MESSFPTFGDLCSEYPALSQTCKSINSVEWKRASPTRRQRGHYHSTSLTKANMSSQTIQLFWEPSLYLCPYCLHSTIHGPFIFVPTVQSIHNRLGTGYKPGVNRLTTASQPSPNPPPSEPSKLRSATKLSSLNFEGLIG